MLFLHDLSVCFNFLFLTKSTANNYPNLELFDTAVMTGQNFVLVIHATSTAHELQLHGNKHAPVAAKGLSMATVPTDLAAQAAQYISRLQSFQSSKLF